MSKKILYKKTNIKEDSLIINCLKASLATIIVCILLAIVFTLIEYIKASQGIYFFAVLIEFLLYIPIFGMIAGLLVSIIWIIFIVLELIRLLTRKTCEEKMMEKFHFEIPSLERKEEIINYLDEFVTFKSDINGSGGLDKIYEGYTFEEALERCLNMSNPEYAKSNNKATGKTFMLIRESDNKIIGTLNLRWDLPEAMQKFGGNIGYGVRPSERRKGYNKLQLYMGLLEAQKVGLDRVMLDCESENAGSYKTMEALGGVMDREEIDPSDGLLTKVYYLDVEDCIEKHKNEYDPYISYK